MADVTIQVIQGLEAGTIHRQLPTPITIGREEENLVQLNDERISRFHAKIQAHESQLILTDLQSTNGTRVNGHFTRMRNVQIGDQIALGRCVLVIGSPEEVAELTRRPGTHPATPSSTADPNELDDPTEPADAFPFGAPNAPEGLSAAQIADLMTLLEYTRTEVLLALAQVFDTDEEDDQVVLMSRAAWHRLQLLPPQLSRYLNHLVDPHRQ